MNWILSLVLSYLPALWILAAAAAGAIYGWALIMLPPGTREPARILATGFAALAVYLWTYAAATEACGERYRRAAEIEMKRQDEINARFKAEATAAAEAALADKAAMTRILNEALARIPDGEDKPPPTATKACPDLGLTDEDIEMLRRIR